MLCISRIEGYPTFVGVIAGSITSVGDVNITCKKLIKLGQQSISISYKVEGEDLNFYATVESDYIQCKTIPFLTRFDNQNFNATISEVPSDAHNITIAD